MQREGCALGELEVVARGVEPQRDLGAGAPPFVGPKSYVVVDNVGLLGVVVLALEDAGALEQVAGIAAAHLAPIALFDRGYHGGVGDDELRLDKPPGVG